MSSLIEHYSVLGVSVGADITEITASYRRLCRIYHPDVSSDPKSEDLMKRINIAYTILRDKLIHEDAPTGADADNTGATSTEAEKEAFSVLHGYFKALSMFDYSGAYAYLSAYDKSQVSKESFIKWRKSVARVFPMREFKITGGMPAATVTYNEGKTAHACRFRIAVTEEDVAKGTTNSDEIYKLVIFEDGSWKVFLGYSGVGEITQAFDERFELKLKCDAAKRWEEHNAGFYPEFNMLSLTGMCKAASTEIYRQKRFGGCLTLAAISIKSGDSQGSGQEQMLRSAAKSINGTLRETDIPAYAGDGVFLVLFVELRKKRAEIIIQRLIEKIRRSAGPLLGAGADIDYAFGAWAASSPASIEAMNEMLKKFNKKI